MVEKIYAWKWGSNLGLQDQQAITPKDFDPSFKTDLDFWDCFGMKTSVL